MAFPNAFRYPDSPHRRKHVPGPVRTGTTYMPWLRDESLFRCVFCLFRERWHADGQAVFRAFDAGPPPGQAGTTTRTAATRAAAPYHDLLYVCRRCNDALTEPTVAASLSLASLPDPRVESMTEHLKVRPDGSIHSDTDEGKNLIDALLLDIEEWRALRRGLLQLMPDLYRTQSTVSLAELHHWLGFPDDLPNLSVPTAPGNCFYSMRRAGTLPDIYE